MGIQAFLEAIEHNLSGLKFFSVGACPGCDECGLPDVDSMDSAEYESADQGDEFSTVSCDSCGSDLAGSRHPAHGFTADDTLIHLDVCVDCLMFHANGELPE